MKKFIYSLIVILCLFNINLFSQSGGFNVKNLAVSGHADINSLQVSSSIAYPSDLSNILIGYSAGTDITSGTHNIAIGNNSLAGISVNLRNTIVGMGAFQSGVGDNNTMVGYQAGGSSISGSRNIFIGYQAGRNVSVSDMLIISNSSDSEPLIYGDFNTDEFLVNGLLKIRDIPVSASTQFLVYDNGVKTTTASLTEIDPTVESYIKAITASDLQHWDLAYDWGNHSNEGYITGYTETDPLYSAVASDVVWWSDTLTEIATQYDLLSVTSSGSGLWYDNSGIITNLNNKLVEISPATGDPTEIVVSGSSGYDGTYNKIGVDYVSGGNYVYFKQDFWCINNNNTSPAHQAAYRSTSLIGTYYEVNGSGAATVSSTAGGDLGLVVDGTGEFLGVKSSNVSVGNALFKAEGEQLTISMVDPVAGVAFDLQVNDMSRLTIPRQGNNLATQMWRSVLIGADKNTLSTASAVDVTLTPFDALFIPCQTGTYGADLGVEHNLQVLGSIRADVKIHTDVLEPVNNVLTITTASGVTINSDITTTGDIEVPADKAFYFGDESTNGSWRIIRNGDNLQFQQRVSGSWSTKDIITGSSVVIPI